jgi:hypothetical protein
MHTHVPWRKKGYSDHWLAAPPSEGDYEFADSFLNGKGSNFVLHPPSGIIDSYEIGNPETILDIARKTDPKEGYLNDEVGRAVANLVAPGVINPKFAGTLPPEFSNSGEISRRLNQMLLHEKNAVRIGNDGPQYNNDLMREALDTYKKQKRKFAGGGLIGAGKRMVLASPEYKEWLDNKPKIIQQIKGQGNQKAADEWQPMIEDFIRSGKWSDIKDQELTNLTPDDFDDILLGNRRAGMAGGGLVKKSFAIAEDIAKKLGTGAKPVVTYTDDAGYTAAIHKGAPSNAFSKSFPADYQRTGTKLVYAPDGRVVSTGYWMNSPEESWGISQQQWNSMSELERAAMEVKQQATAYAPLSE